MVDRTEPRITLQPHSRRVRIYHGDILLADTIRANELRERGYPPCHYLPRDDVRMEQLTRSKTVTNCPFKGDASYYSLDTIDDLAWSYEHPVDEMQSIAGHLAFDTEKVTEQVEW